MQAVGTLKGSHFSLAYVTAEVGPSHINIIRMLEKVSCMIIFTEPLFARYPYSEQHSNIPLSEISLQLGQRIAPGSRRVSRTPPPT